MYCKCILIVALNTPTPPPMGEKIDESVVKPVSSNKILMVETENVKDQSYEYSDQMKVKMLTYSTYPHLITLMWYMVSTCTI